MTVQLQLNLSDTQLTDIIESIFGTEFYNFDYGITDDAVYSTYTDLCNLLHPELIAHIQDLAEKQLEDLYTDNKDGTSSINPIYLTPLLNLIKNQ